MLARIKLASRDPIWGMLEWTLDWSLSVPFKATQVIQMANLCETTWRYENWTVHNRLCKCVGLIAETVELESRCMGSQWIGTLKYSNGSVATGKFLYIVHTWRRRMEGEWVTGTSANELVVCRPIYNWYKKCTTLSFGQQERLNLRVKDGTKCETIVKIKDMHLPNYWVMNTYNIAGICPFRERRVNCDMWPIYTVGQIHRFFCVCNLYWGTEHNRDKRRSE